MNKCPMCQDFEHDLEFVEVTTQNIMSGIAVECLMCGLRGPVAYKEDGEEQAIIFWNKLVMNK